MSPASRLVRVRSTSSRAFRVVLVVISPLWFFTGYVIVALTGQWSWSSGITSLVLITPCVVALVHIRFSATGRKTLRLSRLENTAGTLNAVLMMIALSTAGFAALTLFLGHLGYGYPAPIGLPEAKASYTHYLWNLADAVPLIEVPETLGWTMPAMPGDRTLGPLTVVYKISVVVPMLYAIAQLTLHLMPERERNKSGKHTPSSDGL